MANKFWNTIKGIFSGDKNSNASTGSSGAGTAVSSTAQQPQISQQNNTIRSYNSGIQGTKAYADEHMDEYTAQYNLARRAGVSDQQFLKDYGSGIRWLDQANNNSPAIRQYNSGVKGTREYAEAHMDEYKTQYNLARQAGISDQDFLSLYGNGTRWQDVTKPSITSYNSGIRGTKEYADAHMDEYTEQWQLAKQAGLSDDDFLRAYSEGTRWREEQSFLDAAMGSSKEPGLVDKVTSWANDSQLWNDWQDRRMERWQKKYGSGVFADDFWGQTQANYGQAFLAQELNRMYNDLADNPDDEHDRQYISQLEQMLENYQIRNEKALDDENVQAAWISKHMAGYAPQLVAEVIPAAGAAAVGLLVAGPAGAWNAYRVARTITSGINGYEVTRGASYSSLVKAGASPNTARAAATDEAVISSIIEMGDTAVDLFARIPGLGKILGRGGEQVAVKTVGGILKSYGLNVAQEGAEEFFQEILSAANRERIMAGEGDSGYGGLIKYWLRYQLQLAKGEHSDELAQAMEAAKGGAIIGAVMGGAHLVGGRIQQGINDRQVSSILQRIEENPDGLAYAKDENLEYYLKRAQQDGATKNDNAAKLIQQELDTRNKLRDSIVDQNGKPVYRYMNDEQKTQLKAQLETMQRDDITADKVDLLGLHILYDQCLACGADDRIADMLSDEYYARMHEVEQRQVDAAAQEQTQEIVPEAPQNPVIEEQPAPVAEEPIISPVEEQAQPMETVEAEPENPILETTRRGNRSKYTAKQLQKMTDAQLEQELAKANQLGDQKTVAAIEKELDSREEAANIEAARNGYAEYDDDSIYDPNKGLEAPVAREGRLRAESQKAAAQSWLDSLKKKSEPTKSKPVSTPVVGTSWQTNASNVQFDETGKPIPKKEKRKTYQQEQKEFFGDTTRDSYDREQEGYNEQYLPPDFVTYDEKNNPIPVEGYEEEFAEWWGKDGSYEENRSRNSETSDTAAPILSEDVRSKRVDGNVVLTKTNNLTGNPVEVNVLGKDNDGNEAVLLSEDGKKFVSARSVNKNTPSFLKFLKRLGVFKFIISDGGIKSGKMSNGKLLSLDKDFSSGFYYRGRGIVVCDMNESGTPIHELDHHVIYSAEQVDYGKATSLIGVVIDEAFTDENGTVNKSEIAKAKNLLKYNYRYVSGVVAEFNNWQKNNQNATMEDWFAAYGDIEEELLNDELLSALVGGHALKNEAGEVVMSLSGLSSKVLQSNNYKTLFQLAFSKSKVSQKDVSLLLSLFEKSTIQTAETGKSQTLGEFADMYQQLMLGRDNGQFIQGAKNNINQNAGQMRSGGGGNEGGEGVLGGGERSSASGIGQNDEAVSGSGRENLLLGTQGTESGGAVRPVFGSGEQSGGIISSFENSPEAQRIVTEPRETHGDVSNGSLDDVDAAYEATFGSGEPVSQEERWQSETPRDVTAEEREFAAQQDYEQSEQRAEDAMRGRGERMFMDYGEKDNAWRVFNAAMDITQRKFDFDTKAGEDMTPDDKAKRKAMNSLREAAKAVAEGRTSGYEFAKFLQKAQKDYRLGQYLSGDTEKYLFNAVQSVVDAYEDAVETSSPAAVGRYAHETERAIKMLSKRMERWDLADRQKATLGDEADRTVGSDKRKARRKARFNQSGETFADSAANFLTRMQINPTNVFRGLFGGWNKYGGSLGYQISEQQDNATRVNQSIISKAQMAFLDVRKMKGFQKFAQQKDIKAVNLMGGTMNLSQQQIVGLYKTVRTLLADQRQSVNQISIQDEKGKTQTLYSLNDKGEAIPFSREDLKDMQRELWWNIDEVGKAYLDVADDILEDLGKRNADVEEATYGYRPRTYKKGDYITLRYVTDGKGGGVSDDTIQFKFTQERTRKGGGTILVEPVTATIDRYINQSANHIAYAELGDQLALMNRPDTAGRTLTEILKENYGEQMGQWMTNYVSDMNNFNPKDNTDGVSTMLRKGRQAVQTGALVGSVSVPMKQISSYWAAAGKLRMSTLRKAYRIKFVGAKSKGTQNPLLYYRKVGGIDPTMSEIMNSDGLWAKMRNKSKILQAMEKSIPTMDFRTIDNLYTACVLEVKEDNPRLDVKSEKFQQMVNDKFEDVVISTQPIFTRNARAEYARTNNEFIKMFSMFRTQQTQNLNRIMQAIGEAKASKGTLGEFAAQSELGETIKGQAASALSLSLLTVLADTVLHKLKKYKDEDDEIDPEKVMERIGLNAIEAGSGTVWFADSALKFAIDTINKAQGKSSSEFYGVNMGIVSTIGNAAEAIGNLAKNPTLSNLQYTAGYISQAMGIPLSNAYRMINGAIAWTRDVAGHIEGDDKPGEWDDILRYLDSEVVIHPWGDNLNHKVHVMLNAESKGNDQKADKIFSELPGGDKVDSAIRSDTKSRVLDGSMSRDESEYILDRYTGMEEEDIQKKNDFWEFMRDNPTYNSDEYNISESFVQHWNNEGKPADIPLNQFYECMMKAKNTSSIDVDGDGKANGKGDITKQQQLIEYINGLALTKEQKDALWVAFGYKTTSEAFKKRPWR